MQRLYITDPATTVETQYSGYLRPDRKFEIGVKASNGEADQGDLLLDDAAGSLDFLTVFGGHRKVRLTEDASGAEKTFFRGRVASRELERGHFRADRGRELTLSLEDANADLAGIIVHNWVRPAETGRARVIALLAAYLNGSSSTALNPLGGRYARDSTTIASTYVQNAGNVSMPAETYDATDPLSVLRACAEFENKRLAVYVNDDGTLALYYAPKTETSQLNCTLLVSDNPADVDRVTCFAPNWIAGPGLHLDTDEQVTGMLLVHADGTTYDRRAASEATHDRWEEAAFSSKPATSGTLELSGLLDARQLEQPRRQFAIRLPASKIHLVKAGMRIEVRRAVVSGVDSSTFFRIANVRYSWLSADDSENQYNVIVTLETPVKMASTWSRPAPDNFRRAVGGAVPGYAEFTVTMRMDFLDNLGYIAFILGPNAGFLTGLGVSFFADALSFAPFTIQHWYLRDGLGFNHLGGIFPLGVDVPITIGLTPTTAYAHVGSDNASCAVLSGGSLTTRLILAITRFSGARDEPGKFNNITAGPGLVDDFNRVVAGSWGATPGGLTWIKNTITDTPTWSADGTYGILACATGEAVRLNFPTDALVTTVPTAYYGEAYGTVLVAIADGATSSFTLPYPTAYVPGTLQVWVDGVRQTATEISATAGTFSLPWTPELGDRIDAAWRVPAVV